MVGVINIAKIEPTTTIPIHNLKNATKIYPLLNPVTAIARNVLIIA